MAGMAAAMLGIGLSACSDSDYLDPSAPGAMALDPKQDLTYGNNMVVTGADTLSQERIPLNASQPVEAVSEGGLVTLDCVQEKGRYYLRPRLLKPQNEPSVLDKVTLRLPGDDASTKTLYVSVRQNGPDRETRADDGMTLERRFADIFSYGIFPTTAMGEAITRYQVLDASTVEKYVQVNHQFEKGATWSVSEGNNLKEVNESFGAQLGFAGIPLPGGIGKLSGSLGYNSETKRRYNYQYSTCTKNAECAAAAIDMEMDSLGKYISPNLNKILNTPDYPEKYANTPEGICQLLDDYGPYIPTFSIIGARATYIMSKKQDLEMSSSKWSAEVAAMLTNPKTKDDDTVLGMDKAQLKAYKYIRDGYTAPKVTASFNYTKETVTEQSDLKIDVKMAGGNFTTAKDYSEFTAGDDCKNWVPLSYYGKQQKAQLYALYNFVVDKNSERYKWLKLYIDGDSAKAYYRHRQEVIEEMEPDRWVLAGVKLVVTDKNNFAPIKATCPDGVERVYYPIMFNSAAKGRGKNGWHSNTEGNVLDTEQGDFGRVCRSKAHVWYYALALHSECPGIKSIRFATEDEPRRSDEINCMMPESATTGTGWAASTEDAQLMVVPIKKGDKQSKPVTAFALKDDYGNVFASSGGTEFADNSAHINNFRSFWLDAESASERTTLSPWDCGIYCLHWVHQPHYLLMMYSTKKLSPLDDVKSGYQISHPANMTKGNF